MVDTVARPLTVYYDNKVVVFFSKNNKKSEATCLLDVKYLCCKGTCEER